MARILPPDLETLPPEAAHILEKRSPTFGSATWPAVMAHRPSQMLKVVALMDSFASDSIVPKRYIEIAVVTVSKLNECRHCIDRHAIRLAETGLDAKTIETILEDDAPGLDATERLVRDFAQGVSERSPYLRDALFERMHEHFTDAQIVELTLRITLAGFFNRFNNALQVENGDEVLAALAAHSVRPAPHPRSDA